MTHNISFKGLTADARVLINRAQVECQSHRLTVEDPVTLEYITRYIAGRGIFFIIYRISNNMIVKLKYKLLQGLKQKYTQSNGRRPFGISCLLAGFDYDGVPHLYQTEPSGIYYEWKVCILYRIFVSFRRKKR